MPVNGDAACAPREGDARRLAHGSRRGVMLRPATPEDAAAIADIYAPYVTARAIWVETNPPDASAMRSRIEGCGDLYPWLVATDDCTAVPGFADACPYCPPPANRFLVADDVHGQRRCGLYGTDE